MQEAEYIIGKFIVDIVKKLEKDEAYINYLMKENEQLKNDIAQLKFENH